MNKEQLIKSAAQFIQDSEDNYITEQIALSEDVIGMKIFEEPIFTFGDADDDYFKLLKEPPAIGEHFLLPSEWLPTGKTVISFFLPFSKAVKDGNAKNRVWPSKGWLHGRFEGQALLSKLCMHLKLELIDSGYNSVVPSYDKRFWSKTDSNEDQFPKLSFTSNWSERHVAFVCGLGTFGLSKGLITKKGMAGRFGSIITELYSAPDQRDYKEIYEYCSMCGKCVKNCPSKAISIENGKNHEICSKFCQILDKKNYPRYGCGKCQVNVPCESKIPKMLK